MSGEDIAKVETDPEPPLNRARILEVGDKVVLIGAEPRALKEWGVIGEVGIVESLNAYAARVDGVGDTTHRDQGWFHQRRHLALFADEPEDMEPGTLFSSGGPGDGVLAPLGECAAGVWLKDAPDDLVRLIAEEKP